MGTRNTGVTLRLILSLTLGFLLGLGVASSRPVAPSAVQALRAQADGVAVVGTLSPLPDSIMSALGWTQVRRVKGEWLMCGAVKAIGCYTYKSRKLEVAADQSEWNAWHTLRHERIHMVLGDAHLAHGMRDDSDPTIDDKIADAIADADMQAFMAGEARPK